MKVEFYTDNKKDFADDTLELLRENEVQNSIMVKIATRFKNGEDNKDWYCAAVKDGNGCVILSACCTPPYNIVMYETGNKHDGEAINFLASEMFHAGYTLPGVTGEKVTAELFAESYANIADKKTSVQKTLNVMQLFEVAKIDFAPGFMRETVEEDIYFLPYWEAEFHVDCNADIWIKLPNTIENFKNDAGKSKQYIWFDKTPVSTAKFQRENFSGAVISNVYTPPFYRNKNYCTSLMAQLSRNLLDRGYTYCCLFADADYPVSNKVYQKVGFRNVCLYREIKFE